MLNKMTKEVLVEVRDGGPDVKYRWFHELYPEHIMDVYVASLLIYDAYLKVN